MDFNINEPSDDEFPNILNDNDSDTNGNQSFHTHVLEDPLTYTKNPEDPYNHELIISSFDFSSSNLPSEITDQIVEINKTQNNIQAELEKNSDALDHLEIQYTILLTKLDNIASSLTQSSFSPK